MFDRSKIRTYSLNSRQSKVSLFDVREPKAIADPINSPDFKDLIARIKTARFANKPVILMIGGHPIKLGLSRYIIDLINKGVITHLASNGAASIHDFEIAYAGATSEDVQAQLKDGSFGMAEETGRWMNEAINQDAESGYGFAIGKMIDEKRVDGQGIGGNEKEIDGGIVAGKTIPNRELSLAWNCYKKNIPYTVHVSIGCDIIHQHPACNGSRLGLATFNDFNKFIESVCKLDGREPDGRELGGRGLDSSEMKSGVVLNIGSAVVMPEVFLKAFAVSRNLGYKNLNITTANFDMIDHYRPRVNVVERPTAEGGSGFFFKERHERSIPSLWMELCKC